MQTKEFSTITFLGVYGGLLFLLALTVGLSLIPLGIWNTPLSLVIAAGKTFLVIYFFMKLGLASPALRIVAAAGVLWLLILFGITFSDYFTRFSFGVFGK